MPKRIPKKYGPHHASLFDAILIHCYWLSENSKFNLGLRTRLANKAAALFYDHGRGTKNIVLAGGYLWGQDYPSIAELMAKELQEKYHIPKHAIIIKKDAYSTGGEVETFLNLAQERGWTRLLDIAFDKHLWTIPGVYKKIGENVQFRSVEEILEKQNDPHLESILKKLGRSKYEIDFMLYEAGVWFAMHLPNFDYEKLEEIRKTRSTKKNKDFVVPLDIYNL